MICPVVLCHFGKWSVANQLAAEPDLCGLKRTCKAFFLGPAWGPLESDSSDSCQRSCSRIAGSVLCDVRYLSSKSELPKSLWVDSEQGTDTPNGFFTTSEQVKTGVPLPPERKAKQTYNKPHDAHNWPYPVSRMSQAPDISSAR